MRFTKNFCAIATSIATLAFAAVGLSQIAPTPTRSAFTAPAFQAPKGGSKASSNMITVDADLNMFSGTQTFTLQLPPDADTDSLQALLNGHDVSARFADGTRASLGVEDGLSTVKNVLSVTVKTSSGMASGRWRGMAAPASKSSRVQNTVSLALAKRNASTTLAKGAIAPVAVDPVCDPVAMCPAWLPPSVRFDTIAKGTWDDTTPWIEINGVPSNPYASRVESNYVIAVYNRQTLDMEDFEWFVGEGSSVTNYITKKNYTANDLVVIGTSDGNVTDQGLNTTSIGGSDFSKNPPFLLGSTYMIIGYGGQTPGTAYESVYGNATGSLMEDQNGNYNFQSSDVVEYAIEPHDQGTGGAQTIELNVPKNLSRLGEYRIAFLSPAPSNSNGIWMLPLDRSGLMPPPSNYSGGCYDTISQVTVVRVMANCGTFYAVGPGNSDIDGQWHALANALSQVTNNQIVFLQSIGSVGSGSLAQTVQNSTINTGFRQFASALSALGGVPYAVAGPTFTNQDNYAFVGFKGAPNALSGGAAELSTAYPGQMGVLHGTLQRDRTGLYRPAQSSPEQQGLFNAKGVLDDSDFLLAVAAYQQPSEWPSNSGSVLLPGAGSIASQQSAYRFISHWLLANYYMKSISGPHQDDLHYFFSGSTNTMINYQVFDPANLPSLGAGTWNTFGCNSFNGTTCTFQAPGDSQSSTFTVSDFNAVKAQLSLEVIYLTNTLVYLETGSTNMKDIVASGSGNVGLALTAAASTVEASGMANLNQQQIGDKQVTFSWQSLVGTIGGAAQVAADLEGFGELTPLWSEISSVAQTKLKLVASGANAVGAMAATIGSGATIRTSSTSYSTLAQPFAQLTTTVANLATQNLQSPLIESFDTTVDSITSDWGRLSTIGPRTTNTNDPVFFAPNQITQLGAINALTNASSSTFYEAILPTIYDLHYWYGVSHIGTESGPTVGSEQNHGGVNSGEECDAFYLTPNSLYNSGASLGSLASNLYEDYPEFGGASHPFTQDEGQHSFWVIDGATSKAGTSSTNIEVLDPGLASTLFGSAVGQLNIPMFQMYAGNGPMAGVLKDASVDNPSGWASGSICDASDRSSYGGPNNSDVVGAPAPDGNLPTSTSIVNAGSGVVGHDMVFTTKVATSRQIVTTGSVYISIDGKVVANSSVGTDGTASYTVAGGLSLGTHKIQADYAPGAGYGTSSSPMSTFVVYSESADINVLVPNAAINVSYNASSAPVAMQIGSIAGLSGDVQLSCSGLPAGLACNFNSQSLTLAANGNVNATVQIAPSGMAQSVPAGHRSFRAALAALMLPLLGIGGLRKGPRALKLAVLLLLVSVTSLGVTGCGASSSTSALGHESGKKTITINASVGSVARSTALNINIQ
jgi:hypothetical protein